MLRLTLDEVVLNRVRPDRTPDCVRVSLHGDRSSDIRAESGLRVMLIGHLSPPSGPVEPGGFDFQCHAWFAKLGAVGYARTPLMGVELPQGGMWVFRLRMIMSARIQQLLPNDTGGFAAAITTGDRSAISQTALDDLRASNLAHLLAISGLHMGLMSGVVFEALRIALALVLPLALRLPARSIAAVGALIAAAFYLALSGGNIATQRAFIMVAVALVAVFGFIRDGNIPMGPSWFKPVSAVFISSAVAGIATAPIGAAHFNAIAQFGLMANLASVPLMGVLVIPVAVVAAVLTPLGLEIVGLWIMGLGVDWILLSRILWPSCRRRGPMLSGPMGLCCPYLLWDSLHWCCGKGLCAGAGWSPWRPPLWFGRRRSGPMFWCQIRERWSGL